MKTYLQINILTLFFILVCIHCKGQTDTIVNSVKYNYVSRYENGNIHEMGNILTKGKKTYKNGQWIIFDENGGTIEKGLFKKNKKNGTWYENGSTGTYQSGKKNGTWYTGTEVIIVYRNGKERTRKYINWK